ncbi:MAG: hypothetical protein VYA27_02420, partial [Verrucomicrobiota bacterium]|nr:hypothetical protein [Verrucomicrobiota bacterium]
MATGEVPPLVESQTGSEEETAEPLDEEAEETTDRSLDALQAEVMALRLAEDALRRRDLEEAGAYLTVAMANATFPATTRGALEALDTNHLTAGRRLKTALENAEFALSLWVARTRNRDGEAEGTADEVLKHQTEEVAHRTLSPEFARVEALFQRYKRVDLNDLGPGNNRDLHGQGSPLCRCPVCVPPASLTALADPWRPVFDALADKRMMLKFLRAAYDDIDTDGSVELEIAISCRMGDIHYEKA